MVTNTTLTVGGVTSCATAVDQNNKVTLTVKDVECEADINNNNDDDMMTEVERLTRNNEKLRKGIELLACPQWAKWGGWGKCGVKDVGGQCSQSRSRMCQGIEVKVEVETKQCNKKTCKKVNAFIQSYFNFLHSYLDIPHHRIRRPSQSVPEPALSLSPPVLGDVVRLQTHVPHVSVMLGALEVDLVVQIMRPLVNQNQQYHSQQLPSNP